jgi:ribosomal protein S18 acetylase RimI-like enzyme
VSRAPRRLTDRAKAALVHRTRKIVDVEPLLLVAAERLPASPSVPVRRATRDDLDRLLDFNGAAALPLQRWWRRRRLAADLDRGDVCFVVDEGDAIVGCEFLARRPLRLPHYRVRFRPSPTDAYLHGLRVRGDRRGRGYGESIVLAAMEHHLKHRGGRVFAHVSPRNPVSPYLHVEKLGFDVVGRVRVLVLLNRFGVPLPAALGGSAAGRGVALEMPAKRPG